MIKGSTYLRKDAVENDEVDQHAAARVRNAPHGNFGAKRMAMNFLAGRAERCSHEGVSGLEPE